MKKFSLTLLLISITLVSFSQTVEVELFKNGFSSPVDIQNAGDSRLFIVEQGGRIKILNNDATINPIPFLDISSITSTGSERGLLGLAFHPDYTNNGYFFVNYTNNSGDTQITRYTVDGTDPDVADSGSALPILTIDQPYSNHNGGCVQFGPDGYLYIGMGDGGAGGDPENRSQNLMEMLGKMLRLDIDNTAGGNNYAIPADNPFVGDPNAHDEIWAYGLRNPWRFSFDEQTNNVWIADVGQNQMEEINRESNTEAGLNYGWRCYEGSLPFNTSGCPNPSELTFPLATYPLSGGNCAVTGGYVYRGTIYSDIQDLYFFADVCANTISTIDPDGNVINHGNFGGTWVSFGEDINKELYISDISGSIYKVLGGEIFSITDNDNNKISLTPNPASDSLQVSLTNNLINTITIYDLKGVVVLLKTNVSSSEKIITVNNLQSGVYLVKVTSESGKSVVEKLVIK